MNKGLLLLLVQLLPLAQTMNCQGQCLPQSSCPEFLEDKRSLIPLNKESSAYKQKLADLKSRVCSAGRKTVCCPQKRKTPPETSNTNQPNWFPTVDNSNCGIGYERASFVVGGKDTKLGEFPWTVLLGKRSKKTGKIFWFCGGTLINRWYVLTAAHCGPTIELVRVGEWKVRDKRVYFEGTGQFGNHSDCICRDILDNVPTFCGNKRNKCAPEPQDIPVRDIKSHRRYKQQSSGLAIDDIALVRLKRPVEINEFAKPICLPSDKEAERIKYFGESGEERLLSYGKPLVVGWGRTYTGSDDETETVSTPIQQKLKLPVVNNNDCGDKYSSLLRKNVRGDIKLEEHLCAGGESGKDSCNGDSGGPLIGRDGDDQPFQLVGIVSSGTSRCGIGAPGVFTRVTNYLTWIKRNLV